jgi:hypothetical protein
MITAVLGSDARATQQPGSRDAMAVLTTAMASVPMRTVRAERHGLHGIHWQPQPVPDNTVSFKDALMDMDTLMIYLITGSISGGYFIYGWKQRMLVALMTGIALAVYPMFVHGIWLNILVGLVLLPLPWIWRF